MALSENMDSEYGIQLPNSYIKIKKVIVDHSLKYIQIKYEVYVNREARLNDSRPISVEKIEINTPHNRIPLRDYHDDTFDKYFSVEVLEQKGVNLIKQSYNYMKKLDKFKNVKDV